MLWYKAWRESQTRFLLSVLTIGGLSILLVWYENGARKNMAPEFSTYIGYVWQSVYKGYVRELFVLLTLLLGAGGLLRERVHGTAGFTLALPCSRRRLVVVRSLVGVLQVAVIALIPALLIPTVSWITPERYPFSQALQFSLLWTVCGSAFLAVGLLSSVVFGGEFTAPVVSVVITLLYSLAVELPVIDRYLPNIHDVMSGVDMPYFRADVLLLTRLPWVMMLMITLFVCCLITLASEITRRQDF